LALTACLAIDPAAALAQEDPRKAQAETIFAQGVKLHDAGNNADALVKYRQAYEVYRSPNILFGIARLEQLLGKPLDAARHYREALKSPLLHPRNQELGKGYLAELEKLLVRVDVKAPAGTTIALGDRKLVAPIDEPLDFEPGSISIEGALGDTPYVGAAQGSAGSRVVVELRPKNSSTPSPPIGDGPPPAHGERWGTGQYLGLAVAGAGVVALAAGGGLLIAKGKAGNDVTDLEQLTAANKDSCAGGSTSRPCQDLADKRDERDRYGSLGTAFIVGGGLALAAGGVMFFVWPKTTTSPSAAKLQPVVSPGRGGLVLRF
jgi:hypothetical protein